MKKTFIKISEYLKDSELTKGQNIYTYNQSNGRYWILGVYRDGSVWTGVIKCEIDPETMYIKNKSE